MVGLTCAPAAAEVDFQLSFAGVEIESKSRKAAIRSNLLGAAALWAEHLDAADASIEIELRIDYEAGGGLGSGSSFTVARTGESGGRIVYEQGMAHELRTGIDPNGDEFDVSVVLHPDYLDTFWLDPDPVHRTAPVPPERLDAVTVFLHELGHALAFNGWLDPDTGALRGEALSTYDRHVVTEGRDFFFTGPNAVRVYGEPVPLARTHNNYHHVADVASGPHAALAGDLMNGVTFEYGRRYSISRLDLAMLADAGLPVR